MPLLHHIRRCWWVAAVVAVAFLSPNRASAGCGGHAPGSIYTLVEPESNAAPVEAPAPMPAPCRGPNCSGAPLRDSFPIPPATSVTTEVKDPIRCFTALGDDHPPAHVFDRDPSSARPIHRASSIFHPPRLG